MSTYVVVEVVLASLGCEFRQVGSARIYICGRILFV